MSDVVRDKIWVEIVAKNICHVVSVIENGNLSNIHLLKTITIELRPIQTLKAEEAVSYC